MSTGTGTGPICIFSSTLISLSLFLLGSAHGHTEKRMLVIEKDFKGAAVKRSAVLQSQSLLQEVGREDCLSQNCVCLSAKNRLHLDAKKLGLPKSGSFPPRQQLTFQMPLSTVIFPSSLTIKAQGRALGRVFSGGPAHAGFNDCSHPTRKNTGSNRQSRVPKIPQSLTKTLAPEHVPVFGGWDEVRLEPSKHPRATAFCLLVYFFKKNTKKTDLIYFLKYS